MQAAFVDIGLKKNAFLYIDDVLHPHLEKPQTEAFHLGVANGRPGIDRAGDEGTERRQGARVTTHFRLADAWCTCLLRIMLPSPRKLDVMRREQG